MEFASEKWSGIPHDRGDPRLLGTTNTAGVTDEVRAAVRAGEAPFAGGVAEAWIERARGAAS